MNEKARWMTAAAMLCALSYAAVFIARVPVVLFLKYEPKDVIITIGGFIFGPMTAVFVSVVVSLLEMITISSTGVIGFIMNVISTCAFACTAAYIYKKHQTAKGALAGLITASLAMTAVMLLWNYLITPIYMNYPRQAVVKLLLPAFLPFNLLKSGINTALVLILYKPVVAALRQTKIISEGQVKTEKKINAGVAFFSVFVLITCVLVVMVMNKTI